MENFNVALSFKGRSVELTDITTALSSLELQARALEVLELPKGTTLKLLYKGKRLDGDGPAFTSVPKKTPKIMVMASSIKEVQAMNSKKSDPTIRGFDQEIDRPKVQSKQALHWGPNTAQDKKYKFGRLVACTWQSFGHRPSEETPHAFEAMQLLEKMSTDPGVVGILKERELYVGTLGEMDPIDDRLMQKKQQEGGCLLGYNTNRGLRIEIKLRTDDLRAFRPYHELVATLIHELSHNWVSEHNLLFWTNFGQMRAEYLHSHSALRSSVVNGKTTAEIAGLRRQDLDDVFGFVMGELAVDMAQHGLHPNMIASAIQERCTQLQQRPKGQKLGGSQPVEARSARELALAAAERRSREQQNDKNS